MKLNKLVCFLFLGFTTLFYSCEQPNKTNSSSTSEKIEPIKDKTTATFFCVRHAEKTKDKEDPDLTESGYARANTLAHVLRDVKLDAVYSTEFKRTKETARPSAESNGLNIISYSHKEPTAFSEELRTKYPAGNVLIVGHSNSTPTLVNHLTKNETYQKLDESQYDKIYVVKIDSNGNSNVSLLNYGSKT